MTYLVSSSKIDIRMAYQDQTSRLLNERSVRADSFNQQKKYRVSLSKRSIHLSVIRLPLSSLFVAMKWWIYGPTSWDENHKKSSIADIS